MGIEAALLSIPDIAQIVGGVFGASPFSFLIVFAVFMGVSMLAQHWASSPTSRAMQYVGLSVYVVLEALIVLPLLIVAMLFSKDPNIIPTAGIMTLAVFAGLTAIVFITRKDFSFLGSLLCVLSFAALGFIIVGILFQLTIGIWFCALMIALMAGYILFHTSNVLLHYHTDQHVAAALVLFSCVATLFWYILRILLAFSRD